MPRFTACSQIDTDHTDEAAWKRRAELKKERTARKRAEAAALKAANKKFFSSVHAVEGAEDVASFWGGQQNMDTDLTDERAWMARADLDELSADLKQKEQTDLQIKNAHMRTRLAAIKPQVVITSDFGVKEYTDNSKWIDPFHYDGSTPPRSRDKYFSRRIYVSKLSDDYARDGVEVLATSPPSWLRPWEDYQYAE